MYDDCPSGRYSCLGPQEVRAGILQHSVRRCCLAMKAIKHRTGSEALSTIND